MCACHQQRDAATLTEERAELSDHAEPRGRRPVGVGHPGGMDELLEGGKLRHTAVQAEAEPRRSSRCVRDKLPFIGTSIIIVVQCSSKRSRQEILQEGDFCSYFVKNQKKKQNQEMFSLTSTSFLRRFVFFTKFILKRKQKNTTSLNRFSGRGLSPLPRRHDWRRNIYQSAIKR